jgi:hypothetical protein
MGTLWFCVLVAAAACPSRVFSQGPHDYVPNLPYTAQVVGRGFETLADGTRVRYEDRLVWMRDSQGSMRIENCASHNPNRGDDRCQPAVVNLYIPLRRQFIQLYPGRKTASIMTWGEGPVPSRGQNVGKKTTESLGGRLINGIYAEGTRITTVIPSDSGRGPDVVYVSEDWVSPDLKLIVLHKGTSETTTEIRELDRGEPDASLFEIPSDYKIEPSTDGKTILKR